LAIALSALAGCAPAAGRTPGSATERAAGGPARESHASAHAADPARPPPATPASQASSTIDYASCALPPRLASRGWATELSPTSPDDPLPAPAGTTTIVALPDTQYYAACRAPHLERQARWIADVATARHVVAAVQLGDLTDHNTPEEWAFLKSALAPLSEKLPLALATGNHDHGDEGTANQRGSLFKQYFGELGTASARALTETMTPSDPENAYYRVALAKVTLGILALEWSPRKKTVDWANGVLKKYAKDRVVFVTHAYLYHDGTRYDWRKKGKAQEWNPLDYGTGKASHGDDTSRPSGDGAYDGEMLWNDLLKHHAGVFLALSGHVLADGNAVVTSTGLFGNRVHQVLANFQMLEEGGLGYLRLIEILPDGRTLRMKTYSPSLGLFALAPEQQGELSVDPPLWR
jgi:hypothetical protein